MRKALIIFVVLSALVAPSLSLAEPLDHAARQQAYDTGKQAVTQGKWQEALSIFEGLWRERRTYDVALMLGQVELALERYRDAAEHLAYGLENLPPREKAKTNERSSEFLKVAKSHVATLTIRVNKPNAEVVVNGKAAGTAPLSMPVFTEPGTQTVQASLRGFADAAETVEVMAAEERVIELRLTEAERTTGSMPSAGLETASSTTPSPSAPGPSDADLQRESSTNWTRIGVSSALGVVALGALGVGIGFHAKAGSAEDDGRVLTAEATDQFGPGGCASEPGQSSTLCKDLQTTFDDHEQAAKTASTFYVGAAVLGAGALATYLLWPKRASPSSATLIAPAVLQGGGGLFVSGNF